LEEKGNSEQSIKESRETNDTKTSTHKGMQKFIEESELIKNLGNAEDFIKFKKCYEELTRK